MNYNNFHFTQIPVKTNDVIFLKSPKTFLGHFCVNFCPMGIFPINPSLSQTTIYGPVISCYVSAKTNEPIPRKLTTNRRADLFLKDSSSRGQGSSNLSSANVWWEYTKYMCRGELSTVIARLMSKCLWSGWKW